MTLSFRGFSLTKSTAKQKRKKWFYLNIKVLEVLILLH